MGLTSLENFPKLEDAQIVSYIQYKFFLKIQIELSGNKLTGDDIEILAKQCPKLYKIKIENNEIDNLDKLKCLAPYQIKKINLKGNPIVEKNSDYKKELFDFIPTLVGVDGENKEGEVIESTIYGGEEDEEEEEDYEGEEFDDASGEDYEEGEGDEDDDEDDEDDDDEEKPKKKAKH